MTIQLLQTWNGNPAGIYTWDSGEESRLIGLGLARSWGEGQDGPLTPRQAGIVRMSSQNLSAVAAAGGLTAGATYRASDTGVRLTATSNFAFGRTFGEMRSSLLRPATANLAGIATPDTTHTYSLACASLVPYYAVRIHVQHSGGDGSVGPVTGMKMCLAATDDIGSLDYTAFNTEFKKVVSPLRNAVLYNSLVTDGSPGWKAVTWSKAATLSIPDPGAGKMTTVTSDIIYESGVLDAARGFYPLLLRFYSGSAGYTVASPMTGSNVGTNMLTDAPTRPCVLLTRSGGDYVTTPTGWTPTHTPSLGQGLPVIIEFFTAAGTVCVQMVGDSRLGFGSEFSGTKAYLSLEMYLHNAILSNTKIPSIVFGGISGAVALIDDGSKGNYYSVGNGVQKLPRPASWAVYLIYSVNDGPLTEALATLAIGRAIEFAEGAKNTGQQVLFLTAFPYPGGFSVEALGVLPRLNAAAAAYGDATLDLMSLYGNPDGSWSRFQYASGNHMTDAGYKDLATHIANIVCPQ